MTTHISRRAALSAIALTCAAVVASAGSQPVVNVSRGQLALRGYDAVAYWTDGRPIRGAAGLTHRWNGAEWRFSSAANRAAFAKDPSRYAPRFGGYCAYAVSRGYTADGDPSAWRIVDGHLYLNYSKRVQALWEADIPGHIATGTRNWPGVLQK
jgi:hypothetical protein